MTYDVMSTLPSKLRKASAELAGSKLVVRVPQKTAAPQAASPQAEQERKETNCCTGNLNRNAGKVALPDIPPGIVN